jgi:phage tail-like protein
MAILGSPVTGYLFEFEVEGVPVASIQKVTMPDVEFDAVEYSDGQTSIKHSGRMKVGDLELEKIIGYIDAGENWAWIWLNQQSVGASAVPSTAKRNGRIVLRNEADAIIAAYAFEGAWVKKVSPGSLDKNASDNVMEGVTLSLDRFYKVVLD